jgi:ABC-type Mn2+/Zn2+ transport system permease subunit
MLWVWDMLLYGLVGLAISLGVLMVGPLLTFAFLLLPTMMAIQLAKRFFLVPLLGGFFGVGIALIGFIVSFFMDWPTGATDSLLACLFLGVITLGQWLRRFVSRSISR